MQIIDREIISLLKENARMSYTEMGARLNLSRVTVKTRIDRLQKREFIQKFTVITKDDQPFMLGEELVFFLIKFGRNGDISDLKNLAKDHKIIRGVWGVTGTWDGFIFVAAPSLATITRFRQTLKNLTDIERIETAAVLERLPPP